jgi:Flp pilus assembly pilin Flp
LKRAVEAAKEYVKRFSKDEEDKEIIEYFKTVIPELENL